MQNCWRRRPGGSFQTLGFIILHSAFCLCANAQYSIDWSEISGGGGTSTNGQYTVSGAIGQHDAGGTMTGGNYSLTGGLWGLIAVVQTTNAPLLKIQWVNSTTVKVSWPSPSTGWDLEQNADLRTANWVTPPETVFDDGANKFTIVNAAAGNRLFRLHKP